MTCFKCKQQNKIFTNSIIEKVNKYDILFSYNSGQFTCYKNINDDIIEINTIDLNLNLKDSSCYKKVSINWWEDYKKKIHYHEGNIKYNDLKFCDKCINLYLKYQYKIYIFRKKQLKCVICDEMYPLSNEYLLTDNIKKKEMIEYYSNIDKLNYYNKSEYEYNELINLEYIEMNISKINDLKDMIFYFHINLELNELIQVSICCNKCYNTMKLNIENQILFNELPNYNDDEEYLNIKSIFKYNKVKKLSKLSFKNIDYNIYIELFNKFLFPKNIIKYVKDINL